MIEIDSNKQQSSSGRNTAINNGSISTERVDNASNCTELTDETIHGRKVAIAVQQNLQSKLMPKLGYQRKVLLFLVIQLLITLTQ